MNVKSFVFFTLFSFQALSANPCGKMYLKLTPGVTFTRNPYVRAPQPLWDPAVEGYNSRFGTRTNIGGAVGCEVCSWGSLEVSLAYRGQFKYKKFQTPPPGQQTDFGVKTRRFNLDALTLVGGAFLSGKCINGLFWNCGPGSLYPIIGAAVGISRVLIFDFRSTGLPSLANDNLLSFASDNPYTVRWHFTYQLSAGLEYSFCKCWAFGVGYRWFDAGRINGPRFFRRDNGGAFDAGRKIWEMDLKANELYCDLKVFF